MLVILHFRQIYFTFCHKKLLVRDNQAFEEIIRLRVHFLTEHESFLNIQGTDNLMPADNVGAKSNVLHYIVEGLSIQIPLIFSTPVDIHIRSCFTFFH